jgi:hypothetical protein
MTLTLANMTRVAPSTEHSSLASARVPFVQANDAAGLANAATQLGFQNVAPNQYVHPQDQSWVAFNGGRLERGYKAQVFQGRPGDLGAFPVGGVGAFGSIAAQQVSPQAAGAALTQQLTQLGFVLVLPSYFVHPDQSWVATVPDLGVVRGHGGMRLDPNDVSQPSAPTTTQAAQAPPSTPAAPAAPKGKVADDVLQYPKNAAPSFEDGYYACSLPGRLAHNALATDRPSFLQMGFTEAAPGLFEHQDGSWLAYTSQGTIERGAHQSTFQRVPVGPHRMNIVAPTFQHMKLAAGDATLAGLTAQQVLDGDKVLSAAGFTVARKGLWRHSDGSTIAATGTNVHFGHGQQVFSGQPSLQALAALPVDINAVQRASALWDMPAEPAAAKKFLLANGFTETAKDFFENAGTWVGISAGTLIAGVGANRYQSVPTPALLPQIASTASHSWLSIARTANVAHTDANLAQTLAPLGFSDAGNGLFTANDGSWLVATPTGLVRGHQGQVFSDVPQPPVPGQFQQFTAVPGGSWHDWASTHGFAVARIPVFQGQFTAAEASKIMLHLGFVETQPGQWQHPDGSSVRVNNPTVAPQFAACKFQQWDFGQFPYNRNTNTGTDHLRTWTHMTQETAQWKQWASGAGGAPPWPAFAGP